MPADDVLTSELRAALDALRLADERAKSPGTAEIAQFARFYPNSPDDPEGDWAVAICAQAAHGAFEAGDTAAAAAALRAARVRLLHGMSLLAQASAALDALGMQVERGRYDSDQWTRDQALLRGYLGDASEI